MITAAYFKQVDHLTSILRNSKINCSTSIFLTSGNITYNGYQQSVSTDSLKISSSPTIKINTFKVLYKIFIIVLVLIGCKK